MSGRERRGHGVEDGAGLLVLVLFAVLPLVVEEWLVSEIAIYFAYALFAGSLAFVWGHCGLLSLGQAVFFGTGAYAMSLVTLGMVPGAEGVVSTWLGFAAAVIVPAVLANLIGRFLFLAGGLHGAFFGIVTLAIAFIVERLAINWDYAGGLNGLMNVPPINTGLNGGGAEVFDAWPLYYTNLAVLAAGVAVLSALMRSRYGLVLRAIRGHEARTRMLGYDTARYKVSAFTIGAAVAGLAGALFVTQFGFVSPPLIGFGLSAEVLIWVAVGGRGRLLAACLGAILVRWAESQFSSLLGEWWLLVLGGVFVVVVMYLPHGLVGEVIVRLERAAGRRTRPS
ncbi:MAG: branched-chain amino acid ABC transporter permease [Hyphomicrobiales bacterium]|nr:branched-chain amino acid ABC transporter permease [Hyphomicrobiales bacterium]MCP5373680.1 branched-chain amino acid ABC transporter permease [Hyphomicrobiales bacterium]